MSGSDGLPKLDGFPSTVPDLLIKPDLGNRRHGPHFDIMQGIPGGVDKTRVTPDGSVIGGTTQVGKTKANW